MRGWKSATILKERCMKVKADMMKTKEEKGQKAAINDASNAPKRPAGSFFVFLRAMVEFSKSFKLNFADATLSAEKALSLSKASYMYRLWLVLIPFFCLPIAQAVTVAESTHTIDLVRFTDGYILQICIILFVWGFVCIYLLDILAYESIVSTGLYDRLAAVFVVTLHFSEMSFRLTLNAILGTVFNLCVGVPIRICVHTVFGYDESLCWIVIWNIICALYFALCGQIIDFDRDGALCVFINVLRIVLGVLAGRLYQSTWTILTLIEGGIFWLINRVRVVHIMIFLVNMLLLCRRLGGFLG